LRAANLQVTRKVREKQAHFVLILGAIK